MADYFDCFSVSFGDSEVFFGGKTFVLGQCSTDILNLDDALLTELDVLISKLTPAMKELLEAKTDSAARSAQELLNAVWDVVFTMPVYRDLNMDRFSAYNLFPLLIADQEKLEETLVEGSEGHAMFRQMMDGLEYFPESLRVFRGQVTGMLELYFEPLTRRSAEAYATAYWQYFNDMTTAGSLLFDYDSFEQSFPTKTKFLPMTHPDKSGRVMLAEQTEFTYLTHFLYTDFYRALIAGNAPRRCHNCGTYFLLTAGYNTCYCNKLAPGETERTCRKVGAHKKEAQERVTATPVQKEYNKAYNRLKGRKQRGKMSVDEWNTAVAKAQDLKEQNERGEIDDEELRKQLAEL